MHERQDQSTCTCVIIKLYCYCKPWCISVFIVDVHASNQMARELVYGIESIAVWLLESFSSDRSASS